MKHSIFVAFSVFSLLSCREAPASRSTPSRADSQRAIPDATLQNPQRLEAPDAALSPPPTVAAGIHYTVRVTGGASESDRLPMVVALHGLGDSDLGFIELFGRFGHRARVISLRGTEGFYGGFGWFPPGDADQLSREFGRAVDLVAAALPELARQHPSCGLPVVTGFSQGAMLAYALAARSPSVVRAAAPVAGRLPRAFWPAPRPLGGLLPEVFGLHGTSDDRVSVQRARDTVRGMDSAGFAATLREYPGARHEITPAMERDLFDALARMLGGGC